MAKQKQPQTIIENQAEFVGWLRAKTVTPGSMTGLAESAGVQLSQVSRVLSGARAPSPEFIRAFGWSIVARPPSQ